MYLFKSKINALLPVFLKNTVQDEKRKITNEQVHNDQGHSFKTYVLHMYNVSLNYFEWCLFKNLKNKKVRKSVSSQKDKKTVV